MKKKELELKLKELELKIALLESRPQIFCSGHYCNCNTHQPNWFNPVYPTYGPTYMSPIPGTTICGATTSGFSQTNTTGDVKITFDSLPTTANFGMIS